MRVRASKSAFDPLFQCCDADPSSQTCACPHSMETSSCAPRTCLRCPRCRRTCRTRSRCRSRRLLPRLSSSSRLVSCTRRRTVSAALPCTVHCAVTESLCRAGERRIRVVTTAVPTTNNLSEVFASADQVAIATLLANKAVERSITHKLEDAREAVFSKMVEILGAYKASMTAGGAAASGQLAISENLKMLPVLLLGLLKNVSVPKIRKDASGLMLLVMGRLAFGQAPKSRRTSGRTPRLCSRLYLHNSLYLTSIRPSTRSTTCPRK